MYGNAGPTYNAASQKWTTQVNFSAAAATKGALPGAGDETQASGDFPAGWAWGEGEGFAEGSYVEVSHTVYEAGMAQVGAREGGGGSFCSNFQR